MGCGPIDSRSNRGSGALILLDLARRLSLCQEGFARRIIFSTRGSGVLVLPRVGSNTLARVKERS